MCELINKNQPDNDKKIYISLGEVVKVTIAGDLYETRQLGCAIFCKHNKFGQWEITPPISVGDKKYLYVPKGSYIKLERENHIEPIIPFWKKILISLV